MCDIPTVDHIHFSQLCLAVAMHPRLRVNFDIAVFAFFAFCYFYLNPIYTSFENSLTTVSLNFCKMQSLQSSNYFKMRASV